MRFLDLFGSFTLAACLGACGSSSGLSATSQAVAGSDRLDAGEALVAGEAISSGSTQLIYQGDDNLVLYQGGSAIWATMADLGDGTNVFAMQGDCNAVVYSAAGAVWASGTNGQGSSCYAKVIEGDWFICSGTTRVWSARGGGDCSDGGGGGGGPAGYAGCFTDDGNRALPAYQDGSYSLQACNDRCRSAGYAYSGSQYYDQCFCGNAVGYSQVSDAECNTPCNSGGGECGGAWRNSIYATGASGGGGNSCQGPLECDRVRLLDRWIASHEAGTNRCTAWAGLSWSEKQVFLTITHRLSLYVLARPAYVDNGGFVPGAQPPQYALGGTMLSHMTDLHAIRGTYTGDGGNESRLFLSMDSDLYIATMIANIMSVDDSGYSGWSRSALQTNVAGGVPFYDYIRNSHDFGGPHAPFNTSDESKGGRTDSPGSPTIQSQFWSPDFGYDASGNPYWNWRPWAGGRAQSPVGRPGVESVVDPYIIEIDQDWDLFHHSDPTHSDFSQQYIDDYGNFLPNWTPPCN